MVLTRLNYNACVSSSGRPVTLEFPDDVGEILTADSEEGVSMPFKHYICTRGMS